MKGYSVNIETDALENTDFRKVLFTSTQQQLVVMSIPVGGEIGEEVHPDNDQFIRVEQGTARAHVDDAEYDLADGSVIVIPKGSRHNVVNTSADTELKVYTIYSPPHHKDGTVHPTKVYADEHEEEFDGQTSEL